MIATGPAIPLTVSGWVYGGDMADTEIQWLSTADAARRLGVTTRTLYRFIDGGDLAAYRFGRVIRLKAGEVDEFIEKCRIEPGTLEHLYPEPNTDTSARDGSDT